VTAILTKYLGPTNHRRARVVATADGGKPSHRCFAQWDSELTDDQNHANAALTLARKLEWTGELTLGHTDSGCVFVFSNGDKFTI
jgi:hypothetical protein